MYAYKKGMGVIVMEPLRGGSLVTKIPKPVEKIYNRAKIHRTPADWALRFVLDNPAVTLVLSGMNEDEHIKENLETCSDSNISSLTEEENKILSDVRDKFNELQQVPCTGCAYCLPCPMGIDIPAAFKNLNDYHMFSKTGARFHHISFLGMGYEDRKPHFTSSCIECGLCEKKCPQFIPIREKFKLVQRDLEGPLVKSLSAIGRLVTGGKKR
ncbi:aldo/keto reductase [Thiospirochaeta perfilievii]|nr:aldo/keto reductase [Thiospirochaeta perfilievii]